MTSPRGNDPLEAAPSPLQGLRVLVVEDSWQVATGLKCLLESWGADVAGPVATSADAEHLISEHVPDAAIVDVNLRGGERSFGLIDHLHHLGVHTVVLTGYVDALVPKEKVAVVLHKPMRVDLLLASLCPENRNDRH